MMKKLLGLVTALTVGLLSLGGISLVPNFTHAVHAAYAPLTVSSSALFLNLVSGEGHTCALQVDSTVQCAGVGEEGQLGSGAPYWFPGDNTYVRPTSFNPMVVVTNAEATAPLDNVKQLGAGSFHTCALKFDGSVWCWGRGGSGAIGDGIARDAWHPAFWAVAVTGLPSAVHVAGGESSSCAIDASAEVWCWGRGTNVPVHQGGVSNATALSMGNDYVCALLADQRVQCWQAGASGGGIIPGLTNVVQVTRGFSHTCALKSDSTVWCWGYTGNGQVGNGANIYTQAEWIVQSPTQVVSLYDVVSLSDSKWHTCAVLGNSTVKCWGYNEAGELGDRTTESRSTPVLVQGLSDVVAVHNGRVYSCAITIQGEIVCWGKNEHSQFYDASLVSTLIPIVTPGYGEELPTLNVPEVTGTAAIGGTLTAAVSVPVTVSNSAVERYITKVRTANVNVASVVTPQYQWYRNGAVIKGATGSTYAVGAGDPGSRITVRVRFLRRGFVSGTRTSGAVLVSGASMFSKVPTPKISGITEVGKKLTAVAAKATPAQTSFTYGWRRSGSASVIGTASTYTLTQEDAGHTVTVTVTAQKKGLVSTASSPSLATATVLNVFSIVPKPAILGTARVGQVLSASVLQSTPAQESFSYEWRYQGTNKVIASGSTYRLTSKDLGKRITLVVVANKAGFAVMKSVESTATAKVIR